MSDVISFTSFMQIVSIRDVTDFYNKDDLPIFSRDELTKIRNDDPSWESMVPPAVVREMREKKRWTWYRLAIGADGTWHSFEKQE